MKRVALLAVAMGLLAFVAPPSANGEILAMMNYESKPADSLKSLKLTGPRTRQEGIAVVDVDPKSANFGKILMDIPLPASLVAHHIFFDRSMKKAYLTALGQPSLHVFKLDEFPYRLRRIDVPNCKMGEDVIFSEDNKSWYLTCMGSANVVVGSVATDKVTRTISLPGTYPHGLAEMTGINRLLVTSTISGDLKTPHDFLTVVEASTGKILGRHKTTRKKSPAGVAPVELLRVPGSNPPMVDITNMFGGTMWTATWNPSKRDFDMAEAFDFNKSKSGVPLEVYFRGKRMYVTTANPGKFHIFDISRGAAKPKLLKTLATAAGAHHVAFTKDGRYGFVQNSFINLPGMRDGSVSVVDLRSGKVVRSMDTLKKKGLNPNCIVLLPQWNDLAGH